MRKPSSTPEEIIAAYLKCRSIKKVCEDLHAGSQRIERILDEAGIERSKRVYNIKVTDIYAAAVAEYQAGVEMSDLKNRFKISYTQLYRWLDRLGVKRRTTNRKPPLKKWWCWECGVPTPVQQLFCCEEHRREYRDEAGPNTELGAIYCLNCDAPLPYNLKKFCDTKCNREYFAINRKRPKTNRRRPPDAQAQNKAPPAEASRCTFHRDPGGNLPGSHRAEESEEGRCGRASCGHG